MGWRVAGGAEGARGSAGRFRSAAHPRMSPVRPGPGSLSPLPLGRHPRLDRGPIRFQSGGDRSAAPGPARAALNRREHHACRGCQWIPGQAGDYTEREAWAGVSPVALKERAGVLVDSGPPPTLGCHLCGLDPTLCRRSLSAVTPGLTGGPFVSRAGATGARRPAPHVPHLTGGSITPAGIANGSPVKPGMTRSGRQALSRRYALTPRCGGGRRSGRAPSGRRRARWSPGRTPPRRRPP